MCFFQNPLSLDNIWSSFCSLNLDIGREFELRLPRQEVELVDQLREQWMELLELAEQVRVILLKERRGAFEQELDKQVKVSFSAEQSQLFYSYIHCRTIINSQQLKHEKFGHHVFSFTSGRSVENCMQYSTLEKMSGTVSLLERQEMYTHKRLQICCDQNWSQYRPLRNTIPKQSRSRPKISQQALTPWSYAFKRSFTT